MSSDFVPRAIPRVKIAIFGPSNVGKTLFRNVLLKKDTTDPKPTEKSQTVEVLREYKRPTEFGIGLSVERYKLTLIDVPGKPDMKDERMSALSKVVGWIFMYDSTDPNSPDMLLKMIKEELEFAKKFKSAIAIVVVGAKKDLGPNSDAVKKGEEVAKHLSKHTVRFYGYNVPHVLISCKNPNEVSLTFLCLESINFDLKPPESILEKIKKGIAPPRVAVSVTKKEVEVPPKVEIVKPEISKTPEAVTEKPVLETEIPKVPEPPPSREEPIAEPLAGLESIGKSIEEIPEIPSPTEVLKEISQKPPVKVEQPLARPEEKIPEKREIVAPVVPKPKKVPVEKHVSIRFEIEKDERVLGIVNRIKSFSSVSQLFVLRYVDNIYKVVHHGESLSNTQKQFLEKILSCCKIIEEVCPFHALLFIGSEKSLGIIRGRDIILVEWDNIPPRDILVLMSTISPRNLMKITSPRPSLRDLNITLSQHERHWIYMRRLKRLSEKIINCYLAIPENGSYTISHDGDEYISNEQKEVVKKILSAIENIDAVFNHKIGIIYGQETIIWIKKKGTIIIKSETPPPIELFNIIGAIS